MPDLSEYRFRIELHAHTSPVSPCGRVSPEETVRLYHSLGYDAVVITNHFFIGKIFAPDMEKCDAVAYYLDDYHRACREGERIGIRVLLGVEARLPENQNDYLIYGVSEDDIPALYDHLRDSFADFSAFCRNGKRLLVQAHPFRDAMHRAEPGLLDGIEVFNMHPGHNSAIALAAKWAKENGMLVTGGTDFHRPEYVGMAALRSRILPTSSGLSELLRSRDYLIEIGGTLALPYGNC